MRMLLIVSFVFGASAAQALTLKEKQKKEYYSKELADPKKFEVKQFKELCGYDLPITFEDQMVTVFMEKNTSLSSYCGAPRDAMRNMCKDKIAKEAISSKIKKITCKLGQEKQKEFKLENGELTFTVGIGAPNLQQEAKKWLENNL
jgi:hypothetical protein